MENFQLYYNKTTYNIKTSTKLCLATFEYVVTFEDERFYWLVPSPLLQVISLIGHFLLQYLNIANHRNDIPKGLKTMQLVKKLRTQEKCTHFN